MMRSGACRAMRADYPSATAGTGQSGRVSRLSAAVRLGLATVVAAQLAWATLLPQPVGLRVEARVVCRPDFGGSPAEPCTSPMAAPPQAEYHLSRHGQQDHRPGRAASAGDMEEAVENDPGQHARPL